MQKFLIIAASLLATGTLFAATPGVASAMPGETAVAVSHADLDLATPEGQRRLDRRIARAARTICGIDMQVTGTRMASGDATACYDKALRDVRQRVASAIENGRRGG